MGGDFLPGCGTGQTGFIGNSRSTTECRVINCQVIAAAAGGSPAGNRLARGKRGVGAGLASSSP